MIFASKRSQLSLVRNIKLKLDDRNLCAEGRSFDNLPLNFSFSSFSVQQCMDIFGSKFNESYIISGIDSTNTNYGGFGYLGEKVCNQFHFVFYLLNH